jgi:hypothetical protein
MKDHDTPGRVMGLEIIAFIETGAMFVRLRTIRYMFHSSLQPTT